MHSKSISSLDARTTLRRRHGNVLTLLAVLSFLAFASVNLDAQSFGSPDSLTAGSGTHMTVAADFNGDGLPDLAAANAGDSTVNASVSVFIGAGAGTFYAKQDYPASKNVSAIVAGDFNGDGKPDLAVAHMVVFDAPQQKVSLFLNNGNGTFQAAKESLVGQKAVDLTAADFNKDGKLDLAVACQTDINLLLGNGDGTFQPRTTFPFGPTSYTFYYSAGVVSGDFDGDGNIDLAAVTDGFADVLLGKGDGTFRPRVRYAVGPLSPAVAAGDLNGDAKLDLVTANPSDGTVSVLLGNGDGTFKPKADYASSSVSTFAVKVADLNGDGKNDVVSVGQSNGFSVMTGRGDGTLREPVTFYAGGSSILETVATADLDLDGKADLIGSAPGFGSAPSFVHVLLNRSGARTLSGVVRDETGAPLPDVMVSLSSASVAWGFTKTGPDGAYAFRDMRAESGYVVVPSKRFYNFEPGNRTFEGLPSDATADFVGTRQRYNITGVVSDDVGAPLGGVTVTLGGDASATTTTAGDGSFAFPSLAAGLNYTVTPTLPRVTFSPSSRVFNQLSGNRFAGFNGSPTTYTISGNVLATKPGGTATPVLVTLTGTRTATVSTFVGGNYSFTGLPVGGDYTVTVSPVLTGGFFNGYTLSAPFSRKFTNLSDNATADFNATSFVTTLSTSSPGSTTAADFNGDGKLDVAVSQGIYLNVAMGNGDGTFKSFSTINFAGFAGESAAADLNGDGKLDLAVCDMSDYDRSSVAVFLGNGDGTFQPRATYNVGFSSRPYSLAIADFNGDGKLDIAAANSTRYSSEDVPSVAVLINKGDGTFAAAKQLAVQAFAWAVRAGDFNGDGKVDLATANYSAFGSIASILLGNGDGTFAAPTTYEVGTSPTSVAVGDFNKDGKLDVVTGNSNTYSVLLGKGDGTLQAATNYTVGTGQNYVSTLRPGDFDGDGTLDLAMLGPGNNFVSVLVGKGDGTFKQPASHIPGLNTAGLSAGDFNNDGRLDLLSASNFGNDGIVRVMLNAVAQQTFQFAAANYAASEKDGLAVITVTRAGDATQPASVEYATSNVSASDRSDYTAAVGTLQFAAGETSKSFNVFITDDALVESNETLTIGLGAPAGAMLSGTVTTTLTISSEDAGGGGNPVDDSQFYVRQHYRDFLGRDPDPSGLAFWTSEIEGCGADAQCREVKRVNVSAAFFLSIEFQQTGYLAYRARKAAFGNLAGKPVPVTRNEMLQDVQSIGNGVVVNADNWEQKLEQNKRDYFDQLAASARFAALYPQSLTPGQFVDALNANAGGALSQAERDALVNDLNNGVKTRAQVLRAVAEDADLSKAEFNRAFVLMQYFGYLRRNPDDLPDHDFGGYSFWLSKLDEFNGNYIRAEMVKAFLDSIEYRKRFGQ